MDQKTYRDKCSNFRTLGDVQLVRWRIISTSVSKIASWLEKSTSSAGARRQVDASSRFWFEPDMEVGGATRVRGQRRFTKRKRRQKVLGAKTTDGQELVANRQDEKLRRHCDNACRVVACKRLSDFW